MTICDVCKSLDARTLKVVGSVRTGIDGFQGNFNLDLCRSCMEKLVGPLKPRETLEETMRKQMNECGIETKKPAPE